MQRILPSPDKHIAFVRAFSLLTSHRYTNICSLAEQAFDDGDAVIGAGVGSHGIRDYSGRGWGERGSVRRDAKIEEVCC